MLNVKSFTLLQVLFLGLSTNLVYAASYPPNIDYGSQGDFIAKRGTEFGRTTNLTLVGPLLVNLPEAPGSTSNGVNLRNEDTVWDLSNLTNPTIIRSLTCDSCSLGQPVFAHGTAIRFDNNDAYLFTNNSYWGNPGEDGNYLTFNPAGGNSNQQAVSRRLDWGSDPWSYTLMFSPYNLRRWWEYDDNPSGLQTISNPGGVIS